MPDQKVVNELAKLWANADPDTQWAMVQWIKHNERSIEWPLFPELLAAYARGKREAEKDFGVLDSE
ncbi:MAG: hypothetical protein ACR2PG_27870 [Hyphomicrobiaceae bacterium]